MIRRALVALTGLSSMVLLASLVPLAALGACSDSASGGSASSSSGTKDGGGDAGDSCAILFGSPNENTGLDADQCRPSCSCGSETFTAKTYDDAFIQSLIDDWTLATPYPEITTDPYASPAPPDDPEGTVCGVLPQGDASQKPRPYAPVTYPSEAAATAAGAKVTHFGHCAVCSTLENLAVYMRNDDLTAPVRDCGLASPSTDGGNGDVECLQKLGFDLPCAEAWAYDTAHTKSVCLDICIQNLTAPYNLPDGSLNPCIACDENESGPVFKAVAGRTRRNSGIPNAICRPCGEVRPLIHAY